MIMRRLLIMVLLVAGSVGMMAIPAKKGVYKNLTLADGKEVRAMLVGDEHGHFWRDRRGICLTDSLYFLVL
jgi:hypothetical protein